jgi:predicted transcriptional regulator
VAGKPKTHRPQTEARHVRLYHYLLNSQAWQSLSCVEQCVYIEIAKKYTGSNNGSIGCSVRQLAESRRIGRSTASRALETLQERGFIVAMKKGAFSFKVRHCTEWLLTDHRNDATAFYEQARKLFMSWPEKQFPVPSQTRTVPDVGPFGTRRGTVIAKTPSNDTHSGTVNAV